MVDVNYTQTALNSSVVLHKIPLIDKIRKQQIYACYYNWNKIAARKCKNMDKDISTRRRASVRRLGAPEVQPVTAAVSINAALYSAVCGRHFITNLSGYWSRRINSRDRLIYKTDADNIYIPSCRFHYSDR